MRNQYWLLVMFTICLLLASCSSTTTAPSGSTKSGSSSSNNNQSSSSSGSQASEPNWGMQKKTTGCQVNGKLQDKDCTPGAIIPDATKAKICVPGYAKSVRNVPQGIKTKVYSSYGIKSRKPGQYEIDHLVSLQLGGSNDIANLWPEIDKPVPGFHEKDKVENYLHAQICSGKMTVKQAQIAIATNWMDVYNKMSKNQNTEDSDDSE